MSRVRGFNPGDPRARAQAQERYFARHTAINGGHMTSTDQSNEPTSQPQSDLGVDMKLEVVTLPVSDVDRAKSFYQGLGWRLDSDFVFGEDIRGVQLTPPPPAP